MVNTYKRNTTIITFTSFIMHVILLIVAGVFFSASPQSMVVGNAQVNLVKAYLYQNVANELPEKSSVTAEAKQKSEIKLAHVAKRSSISKPVSKPVSMSQPVSEASNQGQKADELLAMLHTAIQEQQHYPASAMQMERQGRVQVQFTLLTNGNVSDLHIIKSSGTESLDQAALAAVHDAVPFSSVERLIHAAKSFSIDVVFELA